MIIDLSRFNLMGTILLISHRNFKRDVLIVGVHSLIVEQSLRKLVRSVIVSG